MLTIANYNTDAGGEPEDKQLDTAAIRQLVRTRVTSAPDQQRVLTALAAEDVRGLRAESVAALATALCPGCGRGTTAQMEQAIGSTLGQGPETNQSERTEFEAVMAVTTTMSYAKLVPNVIAEPRLQGVVKKGDVGATIGRVEALHTKLGTDLARSLKGYPVGTWVTNLALDADELNVRTPHFNKAGWLPPGTTIAQRQQLATRIGQLVQQGLNKAQQTNRAVTEDEVRGFAVGQLTAPERQLFLWSQHGDHESPYIEIGGIGGNNGRLVFNYENAQFFWTIHYKWHLGHNPFFSITRT